MNLRSLAATLFFGPLLSALPAAYGQEIPANWYRVEVLVFTQSDLFGAEAGPQAPELAYPSPLRQLDQDSLSSQPLPANTSLNERLAALMVASKLLDHDTARAPAPFSPLPSEARRLNPDAYTLDNNGAFRVLFHQAWLQPLASRRHASWVMVNGGAQRGGHDEVEGAIRVYQSRFIHVETDLWLNHFESARLVAEGEDNSTGSSPAPEFRGTRSPATTDSTDVILPERPATPQSPYIAQLEAMDVAMDDGGAPSPEAHPPLSAAPKLAVARVDVLKHNDQITRNQLHYLDHPRMGVLVLVSPALDSDEAEGEEDEDPR